MQRSEATESKRKQGYASESMGKHWKPRESTRELRSLALLARFARPPTITICKNCQKTGQNYQKSIKKKQSPAKASKGLQSPGKARKDWERPGKARKSKQKTRKGQQSPTKSGNNAEKALGRPKGSQTLPKPFQNPPQTLPRPSPNPPKTLPKPSPNASRMAILS